jgi:hypothetical protein
VGRAKQRRKILDATAPKPREQTQERAPQLERETLTWSLGEVVKRQAAERLAKLEAEAD